MKRIVILLLTLSLFLVNCTSTLVAQQQLDSIQAEGWQRVELTSLSLCVPRDLPKKEPKCRHSECYTFENDYIRFGIDIDFDAYRPTFEKKYPSYKTESIWLDEANGVWAWKWSFEEAETKSKYRYHSGVLVNFEYKRNYLVGMSCLSNDATSLDIADKIIRSAKFKKPRG